MTLDAFNKIVEETVQKDIYENLVVKGAEYAVGPDRLVNFKHGAGLTNQTASQVLFGYLLKHLVSIADMVQSGKAYSQELWNEKTKDIICYSILLRGTIQDDNLVTTNKNK